MPYDLKNGQLPFPLNFLASDGGTVDAPFIANDPTVADDSTNWFVVCMTPQQMVDLQSVIATGAPIVFPDTYNEITQFWMQVREYPNEIPEDSCMDLCQLILDCIESSSSIQQSIALYGSTSPIQYHQPQDQASLDAQIVNDPPSCDYNMIFGMTTGFTDLTNTIAEDMLEVFVQATSPAGRIGDIIEAIPGIGILPVDDLFQFVENAINDINDAYAGAYNSQIRNDIRCALFCLAIDNCELDLEDVRDYFLAELAESISIDFWDGFIDDFLEISFGGIQSVWAMHLLIVQSMIFGSQIVGYDTPRLINTIQSLFNDPDGDWVTECIDCATWEETFDFLTSDHSADGFYINNWGDGWFVGLGYRSEAGGTNQELIYTWCTLPAITRLTYYSYTGASTDETNFDVDERNLAAQIMFEGEVETNYDVSSNNALINITRVVYDGVAVDADALRLNTNPEFRTGKWYLTSITLKGTGVNPFD